jgi:hypothetical protein
MFGQVVDVVFSCRYCNWEKVFLPLYMLNRFHAQGTKKPLLFQVLTFGFQTILLMTFGFFLLSKPSSINFFFLGY